MLINSVIVQKNLVSQTSLTWSDQIAKKCYAALAGKWNADYQIEVEGNLTAVEFGKSFPVER